MVQIKFHWFKFFLKNFYTMYLANDSSYIKSQNIKDGYFVCMHFFPLKILFTLQEHSNQLFYFRVCIVHIDKSNLVHQDATTTWSEVSTVNAEIFAWVNFCVFLGGNFPHAKIKHICDTTKGIGLLFNFPHVHFCKRSCQQFRKVFP